MALQPGDFLSLLEMAISYVIEQRARKNRQELLEVRDALKKLRFSKETIEIIRSIQDADEADYIIYQAGRASIKQRDTRRSVEASFEILERFGTKRGISIKAGRLIDQIRNAKFGIRHEIEMSYFNAIKGVSKIETEIITKKIEELNEAIEKLDESLGGAIMSEA
ncbi:hypothetical protein [Mesorhizobium sp. J428]|uniref:hypothetical protein n=1 Tax=Mesorhizobium sp. J428 TaxID=2898440 RepID=UPI002151FDA2|nr:hypothetical protein [Mesorhizobium sp. J428]MCR5856966.1 hypothetical protein [Mesorhizobium sp. J428]